MSQQCVEVDAASDRIQFWKSKAKAWQEIGRAALQKKPRHQEVNMSLAQAFHAIAGKRKLPPTVQSFVQATVSHAHARVQSSQHIKAHSFLGESAAAHKKSMNTALDQLNKMRYEAILELDVEMERCLTYHETAEIQLEASSQAMNGFNAQGAKADGRVMDARGRQDQAQEQIEELRELLVEHEHKCEKDSHVQMQQLEMIQHDMNTANQVMGLTKCKTSLMQCKHPHLMKGKNPVLLELSHNTTRIIQHVTETAQSVKRGRMAATFLQTTSKHRRHHQQSLKTLRRASHRHSRHHKERQSPRAAALAVHKIVEKIKSIQPSMDEIPVSDAPMDEEMQEGKCTINNNPNCEKFVDSMMTIVGETSCKMTEMEMALSEAQAKCNTIKADYESQIEDLQARADDAGVDMAVGTKDKNAAELQARLKKDELLSMEDDFEAQMHECELNIQTADETLCGVENIRFELFKMDGQRPFIQDCEVSEWVRAPCSVTCGGGEQLKTREVITPPTKGSACPPVLERVDCNNFDCPINCQMAEWEEWGKCSADCGGGIRERNRGVQVPAQHGGDPCDVDHITQACNTFSCDSDCGLSPWSEWSPCTKACNGGFQVQKKEVVTPKRGEGQCPPPMQKTEQFRRCNTKACAKKDLKCNSKLDIVVLLDGSGSVGTNGFDLLKKFAEKFIGAVNMGQELAQMAVVLYSGPKTYEDVQKCAKTGDPATCNLHVVSSLTADAAPVTTAVKAMTWPKASSFTAGALNMAGTLLKEGRKDAQSIVMVFTHEMPNFKCQAEEAAAQLRKTARVMWLPIGKYAELEDIERWASTPVRANVYPVAEFTTLDKPEFLQDLIATICPKVA